MRRTTRGGRRIRTSAPRDSMRWTSGRDRTTKGSHRKSSQTVPLSAQVHSHSRSEAVAWRRPPQGLAPDPAMMAACFVPGCVRRGPAGATTGDLTVRTTLTEDRASACMPSSTPAPTSGTPSPAAPPPSPPGPRCLHRDLLGRIRRGQGVGVPSRRLTVRGRRYARLLQDQEQVGHDGQRIDPCRQSSQRR